jgi:hypothetical protein
MSSSLSSSESGLRFLTDRYFWVNRDAKNNPFHALCDREDHE